MQLLNFCCLLSVQVSFQIYLDLFLDILSISTLTSDTFQHAGVENV